MSILQAVILGIVEGITEFLPISSTGHLILTSTLLRIEQTEFLKSFEIAIQLGAILAVVIMYGKKIFYDRELDKRILAGFIPTAIIGFLLYKFIKQYLLGNSWVVVMSLFLGGVALILFEKRLGKKNNNETMKQGTSKTVVSYKDAVIIGLFQSLAVIPGISRSAATIVGGMLLGYNREKIVEFSFLLAIPTMAAATGYDLLKTGLIFTPTDYVLLAIGFITSFITAWVAVKWLLGFVRNNTFVGFGVYRIVIAILFAVLMIW